MAYTILLTKDNSVIRTVKETIVQRSTNIDKIKIFTPRYYGEDNLDMEEFTLLLEYKLPISKKVHIDELILASDTEKAGYLTYKLPLTTSITAENGTVEMHFTFTRTTTNDAGNKIEQVREFTPFEIAITPISEFLTLSDSALSQLAQMYLNTNNQLQAVAGIAESLYNNRVTDISLDIDNGEIYLVNGSIRVGTGFTIEQLSAEVVETAGMNEGNIAVQRI